mmetsp:Transcript_26322/g.54953  ORF Transcript_26322/g.54953 Transcript_26322/m.54953 type:complete len:304 (+) Transcript_26322:157-1068(+)
MVKFPKLKKKKGQEVASFASPTPPAATESPPSSAKSSADAGSRGDTGKEREARQRERAERRRQREKRNEEIRSEHSSKATKKSNKNDKPKLTQEEQDARDAKLGCCTRFAQILVKIIHFVDAAIGLTFLIYGGLMYERFDDPAMEAIIGSLTYGSILLFTSLMGFVGFSFKACKRCGLAMSAWTAPFIGFFYLFVIIALAGDTDTYFNYLNDHKEEMYLDDEEIAMLRNLLPFFYIVMAVFTLIEICRFFVLRQLRERLIQYDAANSRIVSSHLSSSRASSHHSVSNRSNLTEPLLSDGPNVV